MLELDHRKVNSMGYNLAGSLVNCRPYTSLKDEDVTKLEKDVIDK